MKVIFFILIAFVLCAEDTLNVDSLRFLSAEEFELLGVGNIQPNYNICFFSNSKEFCLDFSSDIVKVKGDLPLDSVAKVFIDFVKNEYKFLIDSCVAARMKKEPDD